MFELTINGQTKEFETAEEMAEWRARMMTPKKKKAPRKKFANTSKTGNLKDYLK